MKKYKTISICHLAMMAAIILSPTSQTMAAAAELEVSFEHPHNMLQACSLITKFSQNCIKTYEKISIINPAQNDWSGFSIKHVVEIRMLWLEEPNAFKKTVLWLQTNGNERINRKSSLVMLKMENVLWARGINIDKWKDTIESISELHSEVIKYRLQK